MFFNRFLRRRLSASVKISNAIKSCLMGLDSPSPSSPTSFSSSPCLPVTHSYPFSPHLYLHFIFFHHFHRFPLFINVFHQFPLNVSTQSFHSTFPLSFFHSCVYPFVVLGCVCCYPWCVIFRVWRRAKLIFIDGGAFFLCFQPGTNSNVIKLPAAPVIEFFSISTWDGRDKK